MSDDDGLKTHVSVNVNALLVGKDEQLQLQLAPEEGVAEEMMNRQIEEKMLEIASQYFCGWKNFRVKGVHSGDDSSGEEERLTAGAGVLR